jgi:two-component SAPR family response regulator
MSEVKKPELTPAMRERLNDLYRLLRTRYYTKQELMNVFETGERQIREMISTLSHKVPIISTSGSNMGYKVAIDKTDLDVARYSCGELESRINEIEKRKKPLMDFIDKFSYFD